MNTILANNNERLIPTIIGVADSTHYLVGGVDRLDNFIGLNPPDDVAVFNSLVEAKDYLREQNICSAMLEFQTAYDEMCGANNNGRCSEMIAF